MDIRLSRLHGWKPAGILLLAATLLASCGSPDSASNSVAETSSEPLVATAFDTDFEEAGHTWNSLSAASDGKIYYSFSTTDVDQGAKLFSFDPATEEITDLADLTEVTDGSDEPRIPQGKSHGNFYEIDGKLYISTHVGVHGSVDEGELAITREGYEHYPGGHILTYDLETGEFEDLAIAPDNEGILTFMVDKDRKQAYGITWPWGHFIHYDIEQDELHDLGLISGRGEAGAAGDDFRVLGRSLFVDPQTGYVYFSTADGDIFYYNPETIEINLVEGVDLRLDYFGEQTPAYPGSMGYGWRQIVWVPSEQAAYGMHGKSGYLFRFDPREPSLEVVERLSSTASQKSGMFDTYYYGYLGFDLGPDGETLYYLGGRPIFVDGVRVTEENNEDLGLPSEVVEDMNLVTYNIPDGEYTDHGPIRTADGSHVTAFQAITFGPDNEIYTLGRTERNGEYEMDLVRIPNPVQ